MRLETILRRAELLFPGTVGVVCGDRSWTYAQLVERVRRLRAGLEQQGARPGDRIAVLNFNCHTYLEAYHAIAAAGAVAVPLNYRLAGAELTAILEDAGARLLLADRRFYELVTAARARLDRELTVVWIGAGPAGELEYEALLAGAGNPAAGSAGESDAALAQLYYTSGTTGRAKGVMLTHRNVATHALCAIAELQLTDRDVWLHAAPLFHLADGWATWAITWVGGRHVMIPRFEPAAALGAIERHRVTLTNLVPTMIHSLVHEPSLAGFDRSSLRVLLSGGAPIAPELVAQVLSKLGCDYVQTYGMTETSPYLTLSLLKAHLSRLPADQRLDYQARTGRPFLGVELRVVDPRGQPVRADDRQVGEIIVRGDTVTPGYWNLPEETALSLRDGWLFTGDLATIDAEGYVRIVDRRKDMIVTGGENVYSIEVEQALYSHPEVQECAVIGVPDREWGEAVRAFVVLRAGAKATPSDLIAHCRERIAHYKAPRVVELIEELPKTGSGKIHRRRLREQFRPGS